MPPFPYENITNQYTWADTTGITNGTTIPNLTLDANTLRFECPTFVTSRELDDFVKKIYKIIKDHTYIDISEEEFMDIIKGDEQI